MRQKYCEQILGTFGHLSKKRGDMALKGEGTTVSTRNRNKRIRSNAGK